MIFDSHGEPPPRSPGILIQDRIIRGAPGQLIKYHFLGFVELVIVCFLPWDVIATRFCWDFGGSHQWGILNKKKFGESHMTENIGLSPLPVTVANEGL